MADSLIDELLEDARERMLKSAEAAQHEFATVRTGRASPALLDRVVVDYYGAATPLNQLRELKTEGEASSDDEHRAEVELQKLTDGRVGELDKALKAKEEEILEV